MGGHPSPVFNVLRVTLTAGIMVYIYQYRKVDCFSSASLLWRHFGQTNVISLNQPNKLLIGLHKSGEADERHDSRVQTIRNNRERLIVNTESSWRSDLEECTVAACRSCEIWRELLATTSDCCSESAAEYTTEMHWYHYSRLFNTHNTNAYTGWYKKARPVQFCKGKGKRKRGFV